MPRIILAALLLGGCAFQPGSPSISKAREALNAVYQRSIAAAAVKRPDYVRTLQPIDASQPEVMVAHLQPYPTLDPSRFLWVAPPGQLQALCRGRSDPLLALEEALGLPPDANSNYRVFTFDVPPGDMFRPCASSPAINTTTCSVDVSAQGTPADAAAEHFVLKQMMDSYRIGFSSPGYPFTAMGWTYDWDPRSATHQGASEYVVRPGAVVSHVVSVDPATFCQAPS
jgi:hypothetical protein